MRKLAAWFTFSILLCAPGALYGQQEMRRIWRQSSAPATCRVGDIYFKTSATIGIYSCNVANTWTLTGSFTGGTITSPILAADGTPSADSYSFTSKPSQGLAINTLNGGTETGTNTAATAYTITGDLGTGTGANGTIVVKTGTPQASGTTTHVAATVLTLSDAGSAGTSAPLVTLPAAGTIAWSNDTKLTRNSAGTVASTLGTGTGTVNLSGTYAKFVSGTGVGNGADTTDDPLWTLTAIPANSFTANGDALVLSLVVQGATGNNKRLGLTVGGTQVNTATWTAISMHHATMKVTRVDATHVNVSVDNESWSAGTLSANLVVSDLTANTLAIVVTGASPTTGAANDVKLYAGLAEFKK